MYRVSHKHDSEFVKLFDTKENCKKIVVKLIFRADFQYFKVGMKQLIKNHPELFKI